MAVAAVCSLLTASPSLALFGRYEEADRRVREVRRLAEQQLREERRRSADDLQKAERSARQVRHAARAYFTLTRTLYFLPDT